MTQTQARGVDTREDFDVSTMKNVEKLHAKAVGLMGVLFLTVTGAAPISAMLFNVPIAVGYGNGLGAPASFLIATIILTIFSIGFAAMARKVTAVGGFYSFISHGLGRPLGMALGLGSVIAYGVFEASLCGGFAYFGNLKFPAIPWPYFAIGCALLISVFSYFDVKLSAIILGIALIGEVIILLIFDWGVWSAAGGTSITTAALSPSAAFAGFDAHKAVSTVAAVNGKDLAAGTAAIGLFFAFWSWVGFEMAPNYGEESRDPKRIVPLSLFISVVGLGIFYTITSWMATSAYPSLDDAIYKAQTDSANYYLTPIETQVGPWAKAIMSWLILTSAFACGMAFHNTCARYMYSLGREGGLPGFLGNTHDTYKSPWAASLAQTVFAILIILAFVFYMGSNDPTNQAYLGLYGLMALLGTMMVMIAQAVVSIAVIVYFMREHPDDHNWLTTFICPLIAFVGQAYIIYLLVANIDFLGGGLSFAHWIPWINLGVIVVGLLYAMVLKSADPDRYAKIGRLIFGGMEK